MTCMNRPCFKSCEGELGTIATRNIVDVFLPQNLESDSSLDMVILGSFQVLMFLSAF